MEDQPKKRKVPNKSIKTKNGSLKVATHGIRRRKKRKRTFACQVCSTVYTDYKDMKNCQDGHGVKFPCTGFAPCSKVFASGVGLRQHIRAHTTSTDNKLKCPHPGCARTFVFQSRLKKHMISHSTDRPYKCYIEKCDSTFKNKGDFRRHVKGHEAQLAAREQKAKGEIVTGYPCSECDYVGLTKKQLSDHTIKHKPIPCPECGQMFNHRQKLKNHREKGHAGDKETPDKEKETPPTDPEQSKNTGDEVTPLENTTNVEESKDGEEEVTPVTIPVAYIDNLQCFVDMGEMDACLSQYTFRCEMWRFVEP